MKGFEKLIDEVGDYATRRGDHTSRVVARVLRQLARTPRTREEKMPSICETVDCSLLERHISLLDVRECKDAERAASGYVTTWGIPADHYGDILDRGATRRTHKFWEQAEKRLPLLDTHDTSSVRAIVGYATKFREDSIGLWVRFKVLSGQIGDEIMERVREGLVDAFSIGYIANETRAPTKEERDAGVRRVLTDIDLREVSCVQFPANERARMDLVKAYRGNHPLWGVDPASLPLPERLELIRRRALLLKIEGVLYKGRGVV